MALIQLEEFEVSITASRLNTTGLPAAFAQRTLSQRMAALEHANEVRSDKSALKRDVKAGRRHITDLILDPPACLDKAKVFEVLVMVPKYGRIKTNKILKAARVSPTVTFSQLQPEQRRTLASLLGTATNLPDGGSAIYGRAKVVMPCQTPRKANAVEKLTPAATCRLSGGVLNAR